MTEIVNRNELIDYLMRRQFGALAPPPAPPLGAPRIDVAVSKAKWIRDLHNIGSSDAAPTIENQLAEYEAMSTAALQARAEIAMEEDAGKARARDEQVQIMREKCWPHWAKKDLWSHAELSALCCGLVPDERGMAGDPGKIAGDDSQSIAINRASEDIGRGTLSKALPFVPRDDADRASIMYGTSRHYVPAIAAEWAASRFNKFPTNLLAQVRDHAKASNNPDTPKPSQEKAITTKERNNLLRIIRALDIMAKLPDRGPASSVLKQLENLGFKSPSDDTIRAVISEARKLETD